MVHAKYISHYADFNIAHTERKRGITPIKKKTTFHSPKEDIFNKT